MKGEEKNRETGSDTTKKLVITDSLRACRRRLDEKTKITLNKALKKWFENALEEQAHVKNMYSWE